MRRVRLFVTVAAIQQYILPWRRVKKEPSKIGKHDGKYMNPYIVRILLVRVLHRRVLHSKNV